MTYHGPAVKSKRKNQRQRVLERLLEARGHPVPVYELARIALQYNTRIKELRALGFNITCHETTAADDGSRHTAFSLSPLLSNSEHIPNLPMSSLATGGNQQHSSKKPTGSLDEGDTLFGDISPLGGYPD
jgi:hypothetical protein